MRRRSAVIERALARHRVVVVIAAASLLGLVAGVVTLGAPDGDLLTSRAEDLDAARVATSSTIGSTTSVRSTTTTAATTTTTTASTTTTTTTAAGAVAPTTRPRPKPTAAPATTPPPAPSPAPTVPATAEPAATPATPSGARCLVRLHGKGGNGAGVVKAGDVTVIAPAGNAPGWGGKQWLYFAPASYEAALAGVAPAIDANGCGQVIVDGFSNGAAFAVKLYCRGETFGGRLVGVVADDPVPDHGADGCAPAPDVSLTIYWTGALDAAAQPGWNCAEQDWTCEGGTTVGIGNYAANARTSPKKSPYGNHQWYTDAPEVTAWR